MMNIFNIFDPTTSYFLSMNWLSIFIIMLSPMPYWLLPSRFIMIIKMIFNYLYSEFKYQLKNSYINLIMILSLFFFILINNIMGLFPYIFTSSSHMSFCLAMSLPMWMGMMLFSWMNYTNIMFSHLTPLNTPMMLTSFMVIIETISLIIRPITLSIRLTANMIAGHLLLSLLSSTSLKLSKFLIIMIILPQFLLLTLEIAVSLIQSYVFSMLSLLYMKEI